MSRTSRTDLLKKECKEKLWDYSPPRTQDIHRVFDALCNHAEQLETELYEANERIKQLEKQIKDMEWHLSYPDQ